MVGIFSRFSTTLPRLNNGVSFDISGLYSFMLYPRYSFSSDAAHAFAVTDWSTLPVPEIGLNWVVSSCHNPIQSPRAASPTPTFQVAGVDHYPQRCDHHRHYYDHHDHHDHQQHQAEQSSCHTFNQVDSFLSLWQLPQRAATDFLLLQRRRRSRSASVGVGVGIDVAVGFSYAKLCDVLNNSNKCRS